MSACNPVNPFVPTHFDFLLDPVPEECELDYPSPPHFDFLSVRWSLNPFLAKTLTVLVDRAANAAQRLQTLAEIPAHILPRLELLRKNNSATGLNYDAHTLSLPGITQLQFQKTSKAEQQFWERHSTNWSENPSPRCTLPPPRVDSEPPPWRTPKSPFKFFGDLNTPLPGPFREPIEFRYFKHKLDCPNKISPRDLVDKYDRRQPVQACPHCHGRLRKGESAPDNWCTPLHWDVESQEVFGGRPIPKATPDDREYFGPPGKLPLANFVKSTVVERDRDYPERKDKGPYVVGGWEDWVAPELNLWSLSQESHPLDQNYFEPARMQSAVRNNFCIFTVHDSEANLTFKSPSESNNDEITETELVTKDEKGHRLAKPLRCLKIELQNVFEIREKEEDHAAAAFHALFNDDESNPASEPDFEPAAHYRHDPSKLVPPVFENEGSVARREEYSDKTTDEKFELLRDTLELFRATLPEKQKAISIKKDNLWCATSDNLPRPTKEMQEEWEKVLKGFKLQVLKRGTRETREIPMTRRTTTGRTIPRIDHNSAGGEKVNTLRQREIRRMRKAAKKTDAPLPEGDFLSKYVDKMSLSDADPICQGGCFALVPLHHLELKYLAPYSATVAEVVAALELERRKSLRNAVKYTRKAANRKGISQEVLQGRIDHARARIDLAFDHADVFRRRHCIEHG